MPTGRPHKLSREAILAAAVALADRDGLGALSMRKLGAELGVEAMSLYHHVPNKDALLDALVDGVFSQIDLPDPSLPWRTAIRNRSVSARQVLSAHPWAIGLMESRQTPGLTTLRAHEAFLAVLRDQGFSVALAGHAFSVVDAYVFGFVMTESSLPFEAGESADELASSMAEALPAAEFPRLIEFVSERVLGGSYDYGDEFEVGLDLILDQLAARLRDESA